MSKKILTSLLITLFIFGIFVVADARVFDLRTNKSPKGNSEISFDNLPHLLESAYSGIYVGDSVKISGRSIDSKTIEIIFPSGKKVILPVVDATKGYFERVVTFDEEGTYKIEPEDKTFEVCYRAIPLTGTLFLKDIVNERVTNDDYDKNFINWNNAIALEVGESLREPLPIFSLLITDSNGNPLPNLKVKKFKTNEFGIAKIVVNPNDSIIYGDVRIVRYEKFIFDDKGSFVYASSKQKLQDGFVEDGKLFIDPENLIGAIVLMISHGPDIDVGKDYIMLKNGNAFPAIVKNKDSKTYVNAESILAAIDTRSIYIMGTAIEYYQDRIVIYVALGNGR